MMHDMERAGIEMVNLICDNRNKAPEIIDFPPAGANPARKRSED
jgi:hypothetical protein